MKKYMHTRIFLTALCLFGIFFTTQAFENDLQAICKRPGKNELFIGGEFQTLMVIDAVQGTTLRQFELSHHVMDMQFDPEGKQLIIFDGGAVHFINPDSGEEIRKFEAGEVRLVSNCPYIVDRDWSGNRIDIYSSTDGTKLATYSPGFNALDIGFSSDFSELIVLGKRMDIENEKELILKKVQKIEGYNVYNSAYTSQQEDGEGSMFAIYDLNAKSEKMRSVLPYHTSNSFDFLAVKQGTNYYVLSWDMLLIVDANGKATPVESELATFCYAAGTDASSRYLFLGDTKAGFIYNTADGSLKSFDAREEFEFSYTVDFAFEGNSVYMLADDYSITQLDMQGLVKKRLKVERTSSNGFGVYYSNGFYKKEDRDKEAAIINKELEALGLPIVDLEAKVGDSNVLLGVFGSMDEAEAFEAALDAGGLQYLTKIAPMKGE